MFPASEDPEQRWKTYLAPIFLLYFNTDLGPPVLRVFLYYFFIILQSSHQPGSRRLPPVNNPRPNEDHAISTSRHLHSNMFNE